MASESRTHRVGDQIQRELAAIIQREMHDPRLGMVTLNEVKVSRDLAWADVYFTRMDTDEAGDSEAVLQGAAGFLRSQLAGRMSLRSMPRLRFHFDATAINARRMEDLIDRAVRSDGAAAEGGESGS